MDKMDTNVVCQVGIIVKDIEKTAKEYAKNFGMDMPNVIITDALEAAHTKYRGAASKARAKLAFLQMGQQLQIELIEPDNEPSTWREFLDAHGEGVHHIAFNIKGMGEVVSFFEDNAMPLVQKGDYTGGRYAYIDSVPQLKVMLELLEND